MKLELQCRICSRRFKKHSTGYKKLETHLYQAHQIKQRKIGTHYTVEIERAPAEPVPREMSPPDHSSRRSILIPDKTSPEGWRIDWDTAAERRASRGRR